MHRFVRQKLTHSGQPVNNKNRILDNFVVYSTSYKQYLVLYIKIIHKLLNLWIKCLDPLKIKPLFAMLRLLFAVNSRLK